jgi:hypothetical protein
MIRISTPTLAAVLEHVETHIQRWAQGRANLAPRVYAVDADGVVTVLAFPLPSDDAGRAALGATLEAEMQRRNAVTMVLAMPSRARPIADRGGDDATAREVLILEGRSLAGAPGGMGQATRILAVERRRDGKIERLAPLTAEPAITKA